MTDVWRSAADQRPVDACERFTLLASAIAGQRLEVVAGDPGIRSWTDGRTVFVDAEATRQTQVQCVAVQAALLGAGSLDPRVVRHLARKPSATRRYLSVEGHRALIVLWDLLPTTVRTAADPKTAKRTDSPRSSLALALGSEAIPDPPSTFGVIQPRLVEQVRDDRREGPGSTHVASQERDALLRELEDDVGEGPLVDILSSPVGGGGPIGRLLKRLLGEVRSTGSGAPGADAPSRLARTSNRVSPMGSPSTGRMTTLDESPFGIPRGVIYPEWDVHHRRYRPDWCTVTERQLVDKDGTRTPPGDTRSLRRALARLGTELERHRRQAQGEDLDLDAAIDSYIEMRAGSFPDEAVYTESQRTRRDLSVLVLLDISGSAGEPSTAGGVVHDHQMAAAAGLTAALYEVGDRVALYGFRSQGRSAVHMIRVKRFDEDLSTLTEGRLSGLRPGGFTRLGAAIRHGSSTLELQGGTGRRLLVVLSDGFAYDHGYEGSYGEADARRALTEARRRGTACLCLSIAAATDSEVLRRVFGSSAHSTLGTADQLVDVIAPLFRLALRTAEVQRRRSQQAARSLGRLSMEGSCA